MTGAPWLLRAARAGFLLALIAGTWLATAPTGESSHVTVNDKVNHLAAFAVLTLLLELSLSDRRLDFLRYKGLPLLAYGLFIEIVQYFLPHRSFELLDLAADGLGIFLCWLALPWLRRLPLIRRLA
jgi:VanZ family protein